MNNGNDNIWRRRAAALADLLPRERLHPAVLAWAAAEDRLLASHDVSTLTAFAYARVKAGQPMPGLIEAAPDLPSTLFTSDNRRLL